MLSEFLQVVHLCYYILTIHSYSNNKSNLINFRFNRLFFKQVSSFKMKFSTVLLDSPMVLLFPIIVMFGSPMFFYSIIVLFEPPIVLLTHRIVLLDPPMGLLTHRIV